MEQHELEIFLADLIEMRDVVSSKISKIMESNKDIFAPPFERKIGDARRLKAFFTQEDVYKRYPELRVEIPKQMTFKYKSKRVKDTISWVQDDNPKLLDVDPQLKKNPDKLFELTDKHSSKLKRGQKGFIGKIRAQHEAHKKGVAKIRPITGPQIERVFEILTETVDV